MSGKGQENFEGKLIQFGSEQFPDWVSIAEYFNLWRYTQEAEGGALLKR